jgi:hypothetical protein
MGSSKRKLKVFSLVMFAALATAVVVGAVAQAAPTAAEANWTIEGATFANGQEVACERESTAPNMELKGTIAGVGVTLTAEKVECVEAKLQNSGTTALDTGKLRFSKITVDGLGAECTVTEPITTNAINTKLVNAEVPAKSASGLGDLFEPTTGPTGTFASVTFGSKCGAAVGTFPVKGSVVVETNKLGVLAVSQLIKSNATTREAWPGATLNFGGNPATLNAEVTNTLKTTNVGKKWGAIK